MAHSSGVNSKRCRGKAPKDITDIMLPTTGVIEFSEVDLTVPHPHSLSFLCPLDSSPSPTSATSLSFPSPTTPTENDDAWNLVPYHVSWGHEYHAYRPGKLPGPEGDCILLRSPTPLKNQRTTEACKKCRERKAKCSGGRPSCARCLARGFDCEYASEESVEAPTVAKARKLRRDAPVLSPTISFSSEHWDSPSIDGEAAQLAWSRVDSKGASIKSEDVTMPLDLQVGVFDNYSAGSYWEPTPSVNEMWSMSYTPVSLGGDGFATAPDAMYGGQHAGVYEPHGMSVVQSVLAPQPIRRSSIMQLEVPADSASDSSSSSAVFDSPAIPFSSGALSPATSGTSSAPTPDLEGKALFNISVPCLDSRIPPYFQNTSGMVMPFDGSWVQSPAQAPFSEPLSASMRPQYNVFDQTYVSQV